MSSSLIILFVSSTFFLYFYIKPICLLSDVVETMGLATRERKTSYRTVESWSSQGVN